MLAAVGDCGLGIGLLCRAIHGLQVELLEVEVFKVLRGAVALGVDQLDFVALALFERGASFGADTDPVNARGGDEGAIAFDGDLQMAGMAGLDQGNVQLEQWLATGKDHIGAAALGLAFPAIQEVVGQNIGVGKFATAWAIAANKIGIAEATDGSGTVLFSARPEVAAGKPTKDSCTARVCALSL